MGLAALPGDLIFSVILNIARPVGSVSEFALIQTFTDGEFQLEMKPSKLPPAFSRKQKGGYPD